MYNKKNIFTIIYIVITVLGICLSIFLPKFGFNGGFIIGTIPYGWIIILLSNFPGLIIVYGILALVEAFFPVFFNSSGILQFLGSVFLGIIVFYINVIVVRYIAKRADKKGTTQ